MDAFEVIAALLERVLNGTHLEVDMPHDPVVTVTPGRIIIDGRFGVISGDDLRPIHVEIGTQSLRESAATVTRLSDEPFPRAETAWGNLYTDIQESLAFAVGDSEPGSVLTVVLP